VGRPASYDEALHWLESHVDFERIAPNRAALPSLEQVRSTLAAMADPHRDYPVVHLTGTNGKGTTTTLTSALLAATGLRVGTFTSPDLHAINERIAINGEPIADDELVELFARLYDVEQVTATALTRFELLTVAAYLHFSDEGVDVAVIEVGLGGTWDSTNVIDGDVTVLTNVDLDHTAVLGPTVADIARDKVGIFRTDAIAVVATTNAVVVDIARRRCAEIGSALWCIGENFDLEQNELAVGGRSLTIRTPYETYDDVLLSLHGIHQGVNAATAVVTAEAFLGRALGDDVVRTTLGEARMPGRMELLARHPMIVVDGAHNPAGVNALCATLDGAFHVTGERRCVIGMLKGREVVDMVEPLVHLGFSEFHCAAPNSPRAMPVAEVVEAIRAAGGVAVEHSSVSAALAHARERSSDDDLILCAGSLYLVAEVRGEVLHIPSRHVVHP
jgi:dihydrofolate synthase/folylpolyglutamate synthase